jgi:hypothetical protein
MTLKMIAVSLSNKCIREPRCEFCYAKNEPKRDDWQLKWKIRDLVKENPNATVCFEYNGYGIRTIFDLSRYYCNDHTMTMTTMPECINAGFVGAMKNNGISAISLSFSGDYWLDPKRYAKELCEWEDAAKIIVSAGLPVACNYLIAKIPFRVPVMILEHAAQLNLLTLKPHSGYNESELDFIKGKIEHYKFALKVATDSCLGVQLGYLDKCKPNEDFVHVMPNGDVSGCCFGNMCYMWSKP